MKKFKIYNTSKVYKYLRELDCKNIKSQLSGLSGEKFTFIKGYCPEIVCFIDGYVGNYPVVSVENGEGGIWLTVESDEGERRIPECDVLTGELGSIVTAMFPNVDRVDVSINQDSIFILSTFSNFDGETIYQYKYYKTEMKCLKEFMKVKKNALDMYGFELVESEDGYFKFANPEGKFISAKMKTRKLL